MKKDIQTSYFKPFDNISWQNPSVYYFPFFTIGYLFDKFDAQREPALIDWK